MKTKFFKGNLISIFNNPDEYYVIIDIKQDILYCYQIQNGIVNHEILYKLQAQDVINIPYVKISEDTNITKKLKDINYPTRLECSMTFKPALSMYLSNHILHICVEPKSKNIFKCDSDNNSQVWIKISSVNLGKSVGEIILNNAIPLSI